jgi:hypothetical protein
MEALTPIASGPNSVSTQGKKTLKKGPKIPILKQNLGSSTWPKEEKNMETTHHISIGQHITRRSTPLTNIRSCNTCTNNRFIFQIIGRILCYTRT